MLESLANIGEFVSAIGVIVSVAYLAIQIRHNTKAVRSSSYHQAAEQTWNSCLAVSQNPQLAEIIARANAGEELSPAEQTQLISQDQAMLFGFENMLRLHEEGLLDSEVYRNLIDNSASYLASPRIQKALASRPGPLSQRLRADGRRRGQELG